MYVLIIIIIIIITGIVTPTHANFNNKQNLLPQSSTGRRHTIKWVKTIAFLICTRHTKMGENALRWGSNPKKKGKNRQKDANCPRL